MQKTIMIAVMNNKFWLRPDQIRSVRVAYDGDNIVELKVSTVDGLCHTLDDPEDVKKVMRSMQKTMIGIQNNTLWLCPDQIGFVRATYDGDNYDGDNIVELKVFTIDGPCHTLDDPEDIKKVVRSITFLLPDKDIPF